ncbi:hypothetical protein [Treponema sp.]|uniref:hypothetical protein n=1 Tax=Treponema sp. TaxID=166 RepID=UPI003FD73B44
MRSQVRSMLEKMPSVSNQVELISKVLEISSEVERMRGTIDQTLYSSEYGETLIDVVRGFYAKFADRFLNNSCKNLIFNNNARYSAGSVFYFGEIRFIALRTDCISISVGNEVLLLGDMSEYNNGSVKRLDGVKFGQSD